MPADAAVPAVDVVIPVLDGAEGIRAVLAALGAQQGVDVNVIVADNGSTDGTPDIARALGATVVVESRRSSYAARNRALREVTRDWVAFTDADCVPAPDWLVSAVRRMQETGAELCGGRVQHFPARTLPGRRDALCYLDQAAHVAGGFAATANLVVRREVIEAVEGFDSMRQSGGDLDFCTRARKKGFEIVYAEDAVVWHHARETWGGVLRKAWRVSTAHGRMIARGELTKRYWLFRLRLFLPPRRVREQGPALVVTDLVVRLTEGVGRLTGLVSELLSRRGAA